MKKRLTIIFLVCSVAAKSQLGDPVFETINCINSEARYQKLHSYILANNIDSASKGVNLIFDLYNFESEKYTGSLLNPILDTLYNFQLDYFKKTIINQWRSEFYGSNWGSSKKAKNLNKKFTFTSTPALFYLNDSLIRKTSYTLIGREYPHGDLNSKEFVIVFSDTQEEWVFYFMTEGHWVPYHGNAKKLYLLFNKMPGCVCGCPNELYSIEANSITCIFDNDRTTKHCRNSGGQSYSQHYFATNH